MDSDRKRLMADVQALRCTSWHKEEEKITASLELFDKGDYGSDIVWESDREDVISSLGRVRRPRWNSEPQRVTMTARLTCGQEKAEKKFHLTVLPDEPFRDPMHISDEQFFGNAEGDNLVAGMLNLETPAFSKLKELVKRGQYAAAKEELLHYFRGLEEPPVYGEPYSEGLAEMLIQGVSSLQRYEWYYMGCGMATTAELARIIVELAPLHLQNGAWITYDICAKYNENAGIYIAGKNFPEEQHQPQLRIRTARGWQTFAVKEQAVLCPKAGEPCEKNQELLYAKTYGSYLGKETFHTLLQFHVVLEEETEVLEAQLVLSVKKDTHLTGDKEFYVLFFPENTWVGASAVWSDFQWQFANRNGQTEQDTWEVEPGFDFEYLFQRLRFLYFPRLLADGIVKDRTAAVYHILHTMAEFITVRGGAYSYCIQNDGAIGMGWCNEETSQTVVAGWPRALDAAIRLESFAGVFGAVVKSPWMTAELCCAILKYIGASCRALLMQSVTSPTTNLRQFELVHVLQTAMRFPEFLEHKEWRNQVVQEMQEMLFRVTLPDGTYAEATGGYNHEVCKNFVLFRKQCEENDVALSTDFDARLTKLMWYNALLQGPDGEFLQYGDQMAGRYQEDMYPEAFEWCQDQELQYLLTHGASGIEPKQCSYYFPEGNAVMLRSSWKTDATYLWMQARGGRAHGHEDDNHITLMAGKRVLLTDAGIFTYTSTDRYRQWGISPIAHNTVAVNDLRQIRGKEGKSRIDCFSLGYDVVTMTSQRYEGYSFTREVVFVKPNLLLVTDSIVPRDGAKENCYKQAWHLLPTAQAAFDYDKKTIQSGFNTGPNVVILSLDSDTVLRRENGWYDYSYQQLSENPFGYFEKRGKGAVKFQTLIRIVY
ncbi:MAG: alginate lyase family protein [Clostridia bacterium]|nr:alginate lyase family protein [Clostridia bacterium]